MKRDVYMPATYCGKGDEIYSALCSSISVKDPMESITQITKENPNSTRIDYRFKNKGSEAKVSITFVDRTIPLINLDMGQVVVRGSEMLNSLLSQGIGVSWLHKYVLPTYKQMMKAPGREIVCVKNTTGRKFYSTKYVNETTTITQEISEIPAKEVLTGLERFISGTKSGLDDVKGYAVFVDMYEHNGDVEKAVYTLNLDDDYPNDYLITTTSFIGISLNPRGCQDELQYHVIQRSFTENAQTIQDINKKLESKGFVKKLCTSAIKRALGFGVDAGIAFIETKTGGKGGQVMKMGSVYVKEGIDIAVDVVADCISDD